MFCYRKLGAFLNMKYHFSTKYRGEIGETPMAPSATLSSSASFPVVTGYKAYLSPDISLWDEEGFSGCLVYPCHHAIVTTPLEWTAVSPLSPKRI
jgi:hypothetical protein